MNPLAGDGPQDVEHLWSTARVQLAGAQDASAARVFAALGGAAQHFGRRQILLLQGAASPKTYILERGWIASSVAVESGLRQIVKIHLPGDLVGLPSLASPIAHETLQALTEVEVRPVAAAAIGTLFTDQPRLAALLFLLAQEDRLWLARRLASVARTDARSRIATLILQLRMRLKLACVGTGDRFDAPLTQDDIADVTGLTPIHVNRTLRRLRETGVAKWRRGVVEILDATALEAIAEPLPKATRDTSWLPSV